MRKRAKVNLATRIIRMLAEQRDKYRIVWKGNLTDLLTLFELLRKYTNLNKLTKFASYFKTPDGTNINIGTLYTYRTEIKKDDPDRKQTFEIIMIKQNSPDDPSFRVVYYE
jgi:hypothetical protein